MSITVGLKGRVELTTESCHSALNMGSGVLEVFSTPSMVALLEEAAWKSIGSCLAEGESSVGTGMNFTHVSATPIGTLVWAESEVTEVDGKRVEFSVTAYDTAGMIGSGTHQRFVVGVEKFMAKTEKKREA